MKKQIKKVAKQVKKPVAKAAKKVAKKVEKKLSVKAKVDLSKEEKLALRKETHKTKVTSSKKLKEKLQKETRNLSSRISRVLSFMTLHNGITIIDAINELGDTRLSASVFELKAKGYDVGSIWLEVTNRYGEPRRIKKYFLIHDRTNKPKKKN